MCKIIEKCKWFNDCQNAVVLMIDDLSYGFMDINFKGVNAWNDWGYNCRREKSIFRYLERNLFEKYPEIKYTVFLPFEKHSVSMVETNYSKYNENIFFSDEFKQLLKFINLGGNEIAYHGRHHGSLKPELNNKFTWFNEYKSIDYKVYMSNIIEDIAKIKQELNINIIGGKFPGYSYDKETEKIISDLKFKWYSYDYLLYKSDHKYRNGVLDFPTNFSGNYFNFYYKFPIRELFKTYKFYNFVKNKNLISIQEHFLSTRPDGKRQTPNIFDDINSLDKIFGILRAVDVWYANCSEIANYIDSFDSTEISYDKDGSFEIIYKGNWDKMSLTFFSRNSIFKDINKGNLIKGNYKNGRYVFNDFYPGKFAKI